MKRGFERAIKIVFPIILLYSILILIGTRIDVFNRIAEPFTWIIPGLFILVFMHAQLRWIGLVVGLFFAAIVGYYDLSFLGAFLLPIPFIIGWNNLTRKNIQFWQKAVFAAIYVLIFALVLGPLLEQGFNWLRDALESLSGTSYLLLLLILGGFTAIDLGGPFNKIAFSFSLSAYLDGQYQISGPLLIAPVIPPLALAVCATFFPKLFQGVNNKFKYAAYGASLIGLTEAAIPYLTQRPFRLILSATIASSGAVVFAGLVGLTNRVFAAGVIGLFGTSSVWWQLLAYVIGVAIFCLLYPVLTLLPSNKKR